MSDRDAQMINEALAGREVPEIARRYAVPEEYVDRLIEQSMTQKPKRDWSFRPLPNRIIYSLAAGTAINLAAGNPVGTIAAIVLFVLTSAIVSIRRD